MKSRRMPPLNALRAFEAAARSLSFTGAAKELNVTQAAISHQVKTLEQHLGFRLFRRINNVLVLTDRGEAYFPTLRDAFDRITEGTEGLSSDRTIRELNVSVQSNFALRWLIPRLPRFQARQPKIEIRIFTGYRELDFLREEIDVAVRVGDDAQPDLKRALLFEAEMFPVCCPQLAKTRPFNRPADLLTCTLLHVHYSLEDWSDWLAAADVAVDRHLRGPRFDSYALALEAAIHGCGVAIGRGPFVEDDIRQGRLVVPFDLRIGKKPWYLVWPSTNSNSKLVAFRTWILEEAALTRSQQRS